MTVSAHNVWTGHILDDQDLVETLQQSKGKNQEIYTRVQQSEETEKSINVARKKYLPVSTFALYLALVIYQIVFSVLRD